MSLNKQFTLNTRQQDPDRIAGARHVAGLDSDAPGLRSATLNWAGGEQRITHQEETGTVLPGGHQLRPVPNVRGEKVSYEKTGANDIFAEGE